MSISRKQFLAGLVLAFDADITPDRLMFGNNSDNVPGGNITAFRGFVIRTGSTTCGPL